MKVKVKWKYDMNWVVKIKICYEAKTVYGEWQDLKI